MRRTPSRRNPLTIENRIPLTPELRERVRAARSRVAASMLSPTKHRAIEAATVNSPHNFRVVLFSVASPFQSYDVGLPERTSNAVTLMFTLSPDEIFEIEKTIRTRSGRLSILTAFTYLHRLGDVMVEEGLLIGVLLAEYPLDLELFYNVLSHAQLPENVIRSKAEQLLAAARPCAAASVRYARGGRAPVLDEYIGTHVNSKMVREGYSFDETQAIADLIPLCEFTPASRPLFLPFDPQRMKKRFSAADAAMCDAWAAEMNVLFRNFYNTLIPALYGSVWFI